MEEGEPLLLPPNEVGEGALVVRHPLPPRQEEGGGGGVAVGLLEVGDQSARGFPPARGGVGILKSEL